MGLQRSLLLVLSFLVLVDICTSEFVPVYMWGTRSTSQPVPALHKTSQSSFKDEIANKLEKIPIIVVFAEQSLSPEDFGRRDTAGKVAFPNLSKLQKSSKVTYLSSVQNPIKVIKLASHEVEEISIERLKRNFETPDSRIVIVELNDATEDEQRFDMLKRHDKLIASVYGNLLKKHDNILAIYTAHHASWIGSQELHSRKTRDTLAVSEQAPSNFMNFSSIFVYTSGDVIVTTGETNLPISLSYSVVNETDKVTLKGNGTDKNNSLSVSFQFIKSIGGYWYLQNASIEYKNLSINQNYMATVYAPVGFSYACGNQVFRNGPFSVTFPQFQVQPIFKSTYNTRNYKFDDPYNCVGFTSIPIWSGLFVTFILLLIMTFGLTMMMDIKTMDRFDDAKGKTITINTSE